MFTQVPTQITILDFLTPFFQQNYPEKTMVCWESIMGEDEYGIEFMEGNVAANEVFRDIPGFVPIDEINGHDSVIVLFETTPDMARQMLSKAYDGKWGFGSIFYAWIDGKLRWGRD